MTIRAVIGTVAVLAGFAVLERTVDASTGQADSCKALQAYAPLRPGDRIVVRAEPTPEGEVVGMISAESGTNPVAPVVTLNASTGGWARIALPPASGYTAIEQATPRLFGWIPADRLAVDTRVAGPITIYDRSGPLRSVTGQIEAHDRQFRVLGCRGELMQVINAHEGNTWIDKWCARSDGCNG